MNKICVIIDDGVPGHRNQIEAVSEMLLEASNSLGVQNSSFKVQTVKINVKHKPGWRKKVLFYLLHPFEKHRPGSFSYLRYQLDRADFEVVRKLKADVVISAFGKRAVDVNLWVSRNNKAKSIVVMTPKADIRCFDLAIIPRHDRIGEADNVVLTEGAPNKITQALLDEAGKALMSELKPLSDFTIGLFLGGDYKNFVMRTEVIRALINSLKETLDLTGGEILISTSRRTSPAICDMLESSFAKDPRCRLLIIANKNNRSGIIPAMLSLCSSVVVSPESVTMISEAASSGKYTVVYKDPEFTHQKHQCFLDNLENKNMIQTAEARDIGDKLISYAKGSLKGTDKMNDRKLIISRIKEMMRF